MCAVFAALSICRHLLLGLVDCASILRVSVKTIVVCRTQRQCKLNDQLKETGMVRNSSIDSKWPLFVIGLKVHFMVSFRL